MILVTLGTQDKSFKRLLRAIDKAIENGVIQQKVIVQAGYTKYESNNMEILDFVAVDEFEKLIKKCDILITHGGVGSILTGIDYGKKVIAAARLKMYGEHTNDHQLEVIERFSNDGFIVELSDFENIKEALIKAENLHPKKYISNTQNMIKLLENYIDSH